MKEFFKDFWWMFLIIAASFIVSVAGIVVTIYRVEIQWAQLLLCIAFGLMFLLTGALITCLVFLRIEDKDLGNYSSYNDIYEEIGEYKDVEK